MCHMVQEFAQEYAKEYAEECARESSIITMIQTSMMLNASEEFILQHLEKNFALSPEECKEYINKACEKVSA